MCAGGAPYVFGVAQLVVAAAGAYLVGRISIAPTQGLPGVRLLSSPVRLRVAAWGAVVLWALTLLSTAAYD